jgi:nicotinamidase/pyrazinamidase
LKALLLIDIQYDFLPGGNLAVPDGDAIFPAVNRLQSRFDLVVATQDWHPAGHKSFASSHEGRQPFDTIPWEGGTQVLWPDHCVQGTPGAQLCDALDTRRIEAIFRKGTDPQIDSYSGFWDNGRRKDTGLAHYLRGRGVRQVYVAGLAADYCVYFTARDAVGEGFEAFIIDDATKPIQPDHYLRAQAEFKELGGRMVTGL